MEAVGWHQLELRDMIETIEEEENNKLKQMKEQLDEAFLDLNKKINTY